MKEFISLFQIYILQAPFTVKVPSIISNFTVYKTRGSAVWTRGCAPATWTNLVIIDSGRGFDAINSEYHLSILTSMTSS